MVYDLESSILPWQISNFRSWANMRKGSLEVIFFPYFGPYVHRFYFEKFNYMIMGGTQVNRKWARRELHHAVFLSKKYHDNMLVGLLEKFTLE